MSVGGGSWRETPGGADLRLLPPVGALWAAAWLTPWIGVRGAVLTAAALAAVSVGIVSTRQGRTSAWRVVAVTVLLAAATGCVGSAWRVAALTSGPWRSLAEHSASVHLAGTVTTDPHLGDLGWGGLPTVSLTVRAEQVWSTEGAWRVRSPVVVLGSGDPWARLTPGERVELVGTVRTLPPTSGRSALVFARDGPRLTARESPPEQMADLVRARLRAAVEGRPPDVAGLLPALVVGDTSALPQALVDDLRAAGLAHLTAVSGANVAIVLAAVLGLARWARVRGLALPVVGLLAVAAFVLVARPEPSVLRAAVMGSVGVLGLLASGRRHGPRSLLVACGGLLLVDPWLARSWGFALSVAATAGLLGLAPHLRDRWAGRLPTGVAEVLALAVAAQLATLPLQVALAGSVGLVGVAANVLAAPAVAPATTLGAAAAVVGVVWPGAAAVLAWLAGWPVAWIVAVARWSSTAPLPTLNLPTGVTGLVLVVLGLSGSVVVGRWLLRRAASRRWPRGAALVLVVALPLAWWRGPDQWPPPGWVMVACDVGQGDAVVLNAGPGSAVVVDAGPESGAVDRCLRRLHVSVVPLVVLTHDHADHVDGLPGVLRDREVGQILVSPLAEPPLQAAQVMAWAAEGGVPVGVLAAGQRVEVGPLRWQVLWPARVIRGEGSDPNNASAVLLVEVSGVRLLLTGDIEPAAQQAILASGVDLHADVLKVPHHGSAAQEPAFWSTVAPRLAVVSVGEDNDYGHPDPGLIAALTDSGIAVRRTDLDGDIAVVVHDGVLRVASR